MTTRNVTLGTPSRQLSGVFCDNGSIVTDFDIQVAASQDRFPRREVIRGLLVYCDGDTKGSLNWSDSWPEEETVVGERVPSGIKDLIVTAGNVVELIFYDLTIAGNNTYSTQEWSQARDSNLAGCFLTGVGGTSRGTYLDSVNFWFTCPSRSASSRSTRRTSIPTRTPARTTTTRRRVPPATDLTAGLREAASTLVATASQTSTLQSTATGVADPTGNGSIDAPMVVGIVVGVGLVAAAAALILVARARRRPRGSQDESGPSTSTRLLEPERGNPSNPIRLSVLSPPTPAPAPPTPQPQVYPPPPPQVYPPSHPQGQVPAQQASQSDMYLAPPRNGAGQ